MGLETVSAVELAVRRAISRHVRTGSSLEVGDAVMRVVGPLEARCEALQNELDRLSEAGAASAGEAELRCGRCNRCALSAATKVGTECRMTQPDGYPCGGAFELRSVR
jgi:hypothetical protein